MDNKIEIYIKLIKIIEKQDKLICEKNKLIYDLVNENLEKENIINVLSNQEEYLY